MSIELDPREVLEHLYCLGYTNITKEQLKDFIKDLKKLIKYDLQKGERRYPKTHENYKTCNKENVTRYEPCRAKNFDENIIKCPKETKKEDYKLSCNCKNIDIVINPSLRETPLCGNTNLEGSLHASPSCTCPCNCAVNHRRQCYSKEVWEEPKNNNQDSETSCDQHLKQRDKIKENPSNKKPTSIKPCPSFIRPGTSTKSKLPKGDPVALYHYYKSLWSQQTLPGENSHEDLRWRIRHKMMAPQAKTKGQQATEDKSSKKPEWVSS